MGFDIQNKVVPTNCTFTFYKYHLQQYLKDFSNIQITFLGVVGTPANIYGGDLYNNS